MQKTFALPWVHANSFLDHCQNWSLNTTNQWVPCHQNYLCSGHTPLPSPFLPINPLPTAVATSFRLPKVWAWNSVAPCWLVLKEYTFGPYTLMLVLHETLEVEGISIFLVHPSHEVSSEDSRGGWSWALESGRGTFFTSPSPLKRQVLSIELFHLGLWHLYGLGWEWNMDQLLKVR